MVKSLERKRKCKHCWVERRNTLFSDKNIDSVRHMSGEQTGKRLAVIWCELFLHFMSTELGLSLWPDRNIDDKYYDQSRHNKPKNDTHVVAFILTLETNQCCTFNAQVHVRECPALTWWAGTGICEVNTALCVWMCFCKLSIGLLWLFKTRRVLHKGRPLKAPQNLLCQYFLTVMCVFMKWIELYVILVYRCILEHDDQFFHVIISQKHS